jgi:hypothetical protein
MSFWAVKFTDPLILEQEAKPIYALQFYGSTMTDPMPEAKALVLFTSPEAAQKCVESSELALKTVPVKVEKKQAWLAQFIASVSRYSTVRAGKRVNGMENVMTLPVLIDAVSLVEFKGAKQYDSFSKFLRTEFPMCLRYYQEFKSMEKNVSGYTVATLYDKVVKRYICLAVKGDFDEPNEMIDRIDDIADTTEETQAFGTCLFHTPGEAVNAARKAIQLREEMK